MGVLQYIGARYVPKFYENQNGDSNWTPGTIYEPLTIVMYGANSYTSKKPVPANIGNPQDNPEYWVATGNFNEQLNQVLQELQDIKETVEGVDDYVIATPTYAAGATAANSCMFVAHAGHAFLMDFGFYRCYQQLKNALKEYGVNYIDGVVITHYHGDHDGNPLEAASDYSHWLNDFDFSGCTFYLPNDPPAAVSGWDTNTEQRLRDTFTMATFVKPPFANVDFYGITFSIVNGSNTDYAYYANVTDNYNNYSMMVYGSGMGAEFCYTSDVGEVAQEYLYNNGFAHAVDFMTMPHHGVNGTGSTNFALAMSPKHLHIIDGPAASSAYSDPILAILAMKNTIVTSVRSSFPNICAGSLRNGIYFSGSTQFTGFYGGALNTLPAVYFNSAYAANDGDGSVNKPFNSMPSAVAACNGKYVRLVLQSDAPYMTMAGDGFVYVEGGGHTVAGGDIARGFHVIFDNITGSAEFSVNNGAIAEFNGCTLAGVRPTRAIVYGNNVTLTRALAPYDAIVIMRGVQSTATGYISYGANSQIYLQFDIANIASTNTNGFIYNSGGSTHTPYDDSVPATFMKVYDQTTKRYGFDPTANKPFVVYGNTAHYLTVS